MNNIKLSNKQPKGKRKVLGFYQYEHLLSKPIIYLCKTIGWRRGDIFHKAIAVIDHENMHHIITKTEGKETSLLYDLTNFATDELLRLYFDL